MCHAKGARHRQLNTVLTFLIGREDSTEQERICTGLLLCLRRTFPGTGARGGGKHSRACPGRFAGRNSCLIIERGKFDAHQSCSGKSILHRPLCQSHRHASDCGKDHPFSKGSWFECQVAVLTRILMNSFFSSKNP